MPAFKPHYYLILFLIIAFYGLNNANAQQNEPKPLTDTTKVFNAVEVEPIPIGGMDNYYSFLGKTVRYPLPDKRYNIQGRVIVQFVVEKDGSLSDIKVLRSPSNTLSNETIRVLKMAPNWSPGIQKGKPVRVQYVVPVSFSLGSDDKSFDELVKFLNQYANYPDIIKSNHTKGLMVVKLKVDKNHIGAANITKGIAEDLDKAVINLMMSFTNEIKARNNSYTFIFKFGGDTIDTSSLAGYIGDIDVTALIELPIARK